MDALFGGSESSTKPVDMTPKPFKEVRDPAADILKALFSGGQANPLGGLGDPTPAPTAPIGANEQAILDQLMQQTGPNSQAAQLLQKTLAGNFLPGQGGSNPFLQSAIEAAQRPTLQGLTDVLSKTLPGRFVQAGQFVNPRGSSAFDSTAAGLTRDVGQQLSDIATNMSFGGYESERGRQQEAIKLSQVEVENSIKNLEAQALPRMIQELGIERGMDLFKTKITAILQALGVATGTTVIASEGSSSSSNGIIPALFPKGA